MYVPLHVRMHVRTRIHTLSTMAAHTTHCEASICFTLKKNRFAHTMYVPLHVRMHVRTRIHTLSTMAAHTTHCKAYISTRVSPRRTTPVCEPQPRPCSSTRAKAHNDLDDRPSGPFESEREFAAAARIHA